MAVLMRIRNAFGIEFHGALGTSLIAETWNGIAYIKRYAVPRNPRTKRQQRRRRRFADAVAAWGRLPPAERRRFEEEARDLPLSGYNLFISRFMAGQGGNRGQAGRRSLLRTRRERKEGARAPVAWRAPLTEGLAHMAWMAGPRRKRVARLLERGAAGIGDGSHGGDRTRSNP
jgi:hypothetical protein